MSYQEMLILSREETGQLRKLWLLIWHKLPSRGFKPNVNQNSHVIWLGSKLLSHGSKANLYILHSNEHYTSLFLTWHSKQRRKNVKPWKDIHIWAMPVVWSVMLQRLRTLTDHLRIYDEWFPILTEVNDVGLIQLPTTINL